MAVFARQMNLVTGDIADNGVHTNDIQTAALQDISQRLRFFLGEFFLNTSLGLPYRRDVIGKIVDTEVARLAFRRAILASRYVRAVVSLTLTQNAKTRRATVKFKVILNDDAATVITSDQLANRIFDSTFGVTFA